MKWKFLQKAATKSHRIICGLSENLSKQLAQIEL